ncbi:hypothetical protein BGZ99_006206 [Dissophora globulifera]|uniref:P-type phospholipid transporter n=1 Tax=Dissophora globulifera TaxID=979702 RepID=A0A9P6RH18_9FUNG|nr:hypothetical protein BGZ99_006206 [Dissophora globulifera]
MVNTLRSIYDRTPWRQRHLSQPLSDPNNMSQDGHHDSLAAASPAQLQRQVSIAGPSHSNNDNAGHNNILSATTTNDDGDTTKDGSDAKPLKRGLTRANTRISLRKSNKDSRRVFINMPPPAQYLDKNGAPKFKYGSNKIKTAKYTALSFVPKNLFEQFRRVANMFFLFMAIIQLTPTFTVGSPFLTVFPLCFVISVTAIKDGFEDYKRHIEDRNFNQRICLQLKHVTNFNYPTDSHHAKPGLTKSLGMLHKSKKSTGDQPPIDVNSLAPSDDSSSQVNQQRQSMSGPTAASQPKFVKEQWHKLRVGDVIMLKNNEAVPADAIILSTSEAEGSCFIETKDLDGETNLKTRSSLHETYKYNTARRCSRLKCFVDLEPTNANLFSFNGSLTMVARKRRDAAQGAGASEQPGNNRYSFYAPSITSSMMSSVRGSMDEHRESLEDQHGGAGGVDENDEQLPAQGGTSASDYARLHKSASNKRRSRFSEPLDATHSPSVSSGEEGRDSVNRDARTGYGEPSESAYREDYNPGPGSSSLRPTISKRSSLHRTATVMSTGATSDLAKTVLKANYEQQLQNQHQKQQQQQPQPQHSDMDHGAHVQYKEKTIPVDINNILLRGHVVRNTHWVIAVIVATGTETKIMLNSGETPSKRSRIEKTMNIQVAINFAILVLLCIACAIGSSVYDRRWRHTTAEQLWDLSTKTVVVNGVITFFQSLIIFQNIIPISLYISIEFVKTFQAFFIWRDSDMYDVELDQFCTPKTWNLTDDLGQIEYVFSDKTGTLTRNIMEFKKCSINGKIYGNNAVAGQTDAEKGLEMMNGNQPLSPEQENNSAHPNQHDAKSHNQHQEDKDAVLKDYNAEIRKLFDPVYMDSVENLTFADPELLRDMKSQGSTSSGNGEGSSTLNPTQTRNSEGPSSPHDGSAASNIKDFFTLLALCHTVVVEQPEEEIEDDDDDEFGLYDEPSPTGSPTDEDGKKGSHLGIRNKLKQKVSAIGLPVSGTESNNASKPGTRSRKNSNVASTTLKPAGSDDQLDQHHPNGSGTTLDNQDKSKPTLRYRAESPDEAALVTAAKNVGYVFVSRGATGREAENGKKTSGNSRQNVNVNFLGKNYTYEQLDLIKFNSTRKRMTVIMREPQELGGRILLLTKGADNVIFERLTENSSDQPLRDQTEEDIVTFSNMGLRTLTLALRVLDQETYDAWAAKYAEAGKALDDRAKKMDEVAEEIETDLTLIGATAIEDKLQEGVPDSIAALREAGIKVWVLTGDKLETAINIGFASRLLEKDMKLEILKMARDEKPDRVLQRFKEMVQDVLGGSGSTKEESGTGYIAKASENKQEKHDQEKPSSFSVEQQQQQGQPNQPSPLDEKHLPRTPSDTSLLHTPSQPTTQSSQQHALIVDGSALKVILDDEEARKDLIRLSDVCFSVICCRASPLQKALVVELIRRGKKTVCLAIGDGANDVSMIQAANIGVGIAGQEGMQAAMASDYSITQFRFIRKLVLVHGHWGYMRIAEMILNFFYKNVLWVGAVLWFQIYCGWSAVLFYDYTFVSLYNLILTAVPVVVLGATDQDLTAPYVLRFPGVYKLGIEQKRYSQWRFVLYMLDGVWQSLIVFWFWRGVYGMNVLSQNGMDGSLLDFSTSVAMANVIIASFFVGLDTYHWTWIMHVAVWGSIAFLFAMVLVYGAFSGSPIHDVAIRLFSQGPFWFMLVLSVVSALLVRYAVLFISFWWYPDDVHVVRGIMISEKRNANAKKVKWTGLAPDGMAPREQSEQEKAILKKEIEAMAAKEAAKEKKKAAKLAGKHGSRAKNQQDNGGEEQSYDLTMIQINVDDRSQELSNENRGRS